MSSSDLNYFISVGRPVSHTLAGLLKSISGSFNYVEQSIKVDAKRRTIEAMIVKDTCPRDRFY